MTERALELFLQHSTLAPRPGLEPLKESLQPEERRLAEALRQLLAATGQSMRAYGPSVNRSPSVVSRYLSGERIPDKEFIDGLLMKVMRHHRQLVPADVQEHLYDLHREALRVSAPSRHKVQLLTDELGDAIIRQEQADAQVKTLEDTVAEREQQLVELHMRTRQIESDRAADRNQNHAALVAYHHREEELEDECRRLEAEVARLRVELDEAKALHHEAEERCDALERQLVAIEEDAEREALAQAVHVEREYLEQSAQAEADAQRALQEAHAAMARAAEEAAEAQRDAQLLRRKAANEAEELVSAATVEAQLRRRKAGDEAEETVRAATEEAKRTLHHARKQADEMRARGQEELDELTAVQLQRRKAASDAAKETVRAATEEAERTLHHARKQADEMRARGQDELAELTARRNELVAEMTRVQGILASLGQVPSQAPPPEFASFGPFPGNPFAGGNPEFFDNGTNGSKRRGWRGRG